MFACMAQAYDALSDGLKETLRGLRGVHSSRHVFGAKSLQTNPDRQGRLVNPELATQDAVHPVVIRHPESGRHTLYVNSNFTTHFEGWTAKESKPLLEFLYQHARAAGIPDPLHMGGRLNRVLGQSGDLALRAERLSGRTPADASHHDRGRTTGGGALGPPPPAAVVATHAVLGLAIDLALDVGEAEVAQRRGIQRAQQA